MLTLSNLPVGEGEEKEEHVLVTLHFYHSPLNSSSPWFKVLHESGAGIKNYVHDPHTVPVNDIRGRTSDFTLEQHSFAAISGLPEYDAIKHKADQIYTQRYGEAILRKAVPNILKVFVFDVTVRRADPAERLRKPVKKVHIDQSKNGARGRMQQLLSVEDQKHITQGRLRFRIINIWQPLEGPITDNPLACADSSTLKTEDLVPIEHRYETRTGETYGVRFSPAQRFYWWSRMTPQDALLLQCYDSTTESRCAHAAFRLLGDAETNTRKSVEIRCLITEDIRSTSSGPCQAYTRQGSE